MKAFWIFSPAVSILVTEHNPKIAGAPLVYQISRMDSETLGAVMRDWNHTMPVHVISILVPQPGTPTRNVNANLGKIFPLICQHIKVRNVLLVDLFVKNVTWFWAYLCFSRSLDQYGQVRRFCWSSRAGVQWLAVELVSYLSMPFMMWWRAS